MSKDDLSQDILKEIFNINVGQAANMLSEIINKKILLDVPSIQIIDYNKDNFKIEDTFENIPEGALMLSSINFNKEIQGEANLIFPANKMRTFINLCMNEEDNEDDQEMHFTDMDFDIVREVGNIILNAIIGGIGNFLDLSLEYTIPEVRIYDRADFKEKIISKDELCIIMLYITFIIEDIEIEGGIIINLKLNSLKELMEQIKRMEADLDE